MSATILQRIHALSEAAVPATYTRLAQILRQLDSEKSAPEKAHGVTAVVMKLAPAEQELVLAAVESLRPKP